MSPNGQTRGGKIAAVDNIYTVILAAACVLVLVTVGVVAYMSYSHYGTIFKIP